MIPLLLALSASAGTNTDVTSGVVAFNQQDYDLAIDKLEAALSEPVRLKAKNVPRAHAYLAQALLGAMSQAAAAGDTAALTALQDAPVQAAESLLIARDSPDYRWSGADEAALQRTEGLLLQGVLGALSMAEGDGGLDAFVPWADAAVSLGGHLACDLRGQLRERMGDKAGAYADYQEALSRFRATPPERPELLIAYTAYRAAIYARYEAGDLTAALAHIEDGLALLDAQHARIDAPDASQQRQHADALADLSNFRLDILLNAPDLYETALSEFAAAVAVEPESYVKRVAYAQLLERTDRAAAMKEYAAAVELAPERSEALFSLGALYVNDAVALFQEANNEADYGMAASLQAEGQAKFLLARPYLERALEIEPGNREIIRALKQIAIQTDDIEEYRRLQALEAAAQ